VVAAWASATPPTGLTAASGIGIYASAEYIGPYVLDICKTKPQICVAPVGYAKNAIHVKCKVVPCIVVDPLPRNCTVKWACPGCRPGGLCPPYYHVVFDETLRFWRVDVIDDKGRLVTHEMRTVGRSTVLTVRPSRAEMRDGEIANYSLVFKGGGGITAGTDYAIRMRLEVSDSPVLDLARVPR